MASQFGEVEVTISSAKDLKNVNWRHGPLRPYAVIWINPSQKLTTRVDEGDDTFPRWDQTLIVPLDTPPSESTLFIDIIHAHAADDTKPLVGSAQLPLCNFLSGDPRATMTLELLRPSGRPQGTITIEVRLCQSERYGTRDYYAPQPAYGTQYGAVPAQPAYAEPVYGQEVYGYRQQPVVEEEKSKFGMGTGLAVGAVAGALGGLALAEGFDALEDHVADEAAEKVEDEDYEEGDEGGCC